ncbi:amidase [Diplogelasinospora grovesii]|uniref:Amidase n=1 Tax=Diplogelasinospora grovesii TaxID=303347 RepID=A0AAN6S6U0_9PEZI|nr:amidase [Diplogelasinospora grovesii]
MTDPSPAPAFDVLSATALELQNRLQNASLTNIVLTYLAQIHRHNSAGANLNLIISLRDRDQLLADARARDEERKAGKLKSPFHGIPFIAKDAYATAPELGLPTTVGSFALKDSQPRANAVAIDTLIAAGMILIGKSNLSEFCGCKGNVGWSAVGGQGQSAWVPGGLKEGDPPRGPTAPGGSSTGSAHGVAAGFVPLSIGTEACGSMITPAGRAGVYTLKLTPGSANTDGICKITIAWDTIGGFATTVKELAILSDLLLDTGDQAKDRKPLTDYLRKDFAGLRVGFVDPEKWAIEDDAREADPDFPGEIKSQFEWAMRSIKEAGGEVVYPVDIPAYETFFHEGQPLLGMITNAEVKICVNEYIESLTTSSVKSLDDIIAFNKKNPSLELPPGNAGQEGLIAAAESNLTEKDLPFLRDLFYSKAGKNGVEKAIRHHNLDVIVAPVDSPVQSVSTGSMTPAAAVPLGYAKINGHPFGAQLLGLQRNEPKLIEVMSAWEAMFPSRRVPDLSWAERVAQEPGLRVQ